MAEMINKQHLLEQIDTTGKGCGYEGSEFLAYQEAMLAVVELIEEEPAVEKEYDVMFIGTEHMDSPGPAPAVGYRIAAKSREDAVRKGKSYAEAQHPAFIPFAFVGPVIEVPKDDFRSIREAAINLAVEAIQVAAMTKKFEHGQRNNWPGAREDSHGEEKENRAGSGNGDNHHEQTGGRSGKDGL